MKYCISYYFKYCISKQLLKCLLKLPSQEFFILKWFAFTLSVTTDRHMALVHRVMVDPDLENPRITMTSLEDSPRWDEIENCLKLNDVKELDKIIKKQSLAVVWRISKGPEKETLLHKASELGNIACIRLLIAACRDAGISIDSPDCEGNTPLFCAVKAVQIEAVKELLDASVHVNARNDQGHSVLHTIAYAVSSAKENEKQDKLMKCLEIILERPDIDLEAHNNSGFTPLYAAAKKIPPDEGVRRINKTVLFCRKIVEKGASLESFDRKNVSARQVLEERNALTAVLMGERCSPPSRPFISMFLDCLLMGANGEKVSELLNGQAQEEANRAANSYLGSQTVLFYEVNKSDIKGVEALLAAGADVWKEQISGELCLHRSLSRGNPEILNLLINSMKDKRNLRQLDLTSQSYDLLKKLLETNPKSSGRNANQDHLECLKRILENDVQIDLNKMSGDDVCQSVLHVAASFNNQEALQLLIEKGAFIGVRKSVFGEDRGNILNALRTQTLHKAMDCCITHKPSDDESESGAAENTLNPDYTLRLDYRFLVPPAHPESIKEPPRNNEIKTLMELSQTQAHRKAITHPLIQTLLYAKWRRVLPLYLINLFLYLGFVIFLTLFLYTLRDLRINEARALKISNSTLEEEVSSSRQNMHILLIFLVPLTLYMLAREVFQIIYTYRSYLKNFENYLEWFLIIIVLLLSVVDFGVDPTRHLAAWAMIIAWYEFVLLLGRAPPLAIYVTMLRHVSWNFLKLIFLYGALILAFTVSFNIILQPVKVEDSGTEFGNFWSTLPKAIVMATGEFEYTDLRSNFFSSKVIFATSAVLVFLVFLFLIFLVLMNVMNGLAVTDTQQVMEEATLYSLKSRLELIFLIEEMLLMGACLAKILQKIQLISPPRSPHLLVKVNYPDKKLRISYGRSSRETCKLDNETAHILRSYRLQIIAEEEERSRVNPAEQCLLLLTELRRELTTRSPGALSPETGSPSSGRARFP